MIFNQTLLYDFTKKKHPKPSQTQNLPFIHSLIFWLLMCFTDSASHAFECNSSHKHQELESQQSLFKGAQTDGT